MPTLPLVLADAQSLPYDELCYGLGVFVVLVLLFNYLTQSGTIARATIKESLRQPVFLLLTAIGILVILGNIFIPFFSMGDDTKMFIDCGLATVMICSLLLAVWSSSTSVAEEIEGKTAMTLLSKPINRRQFVLGKYMGIVQTALFMIGILGVIFFFATYFKFWYDLRESGKEQGELFFMRDVGLPFHVPFMVEKIFNVARTILPGLVLIGMEVAVMAAVSVAISTRMPMLVNISSCFAIFVVSHLTPVLAQAKGQNVFVKFVANLLATILPGLDHFNMSAAVATGKNIPPDYIGLAGIYCLTYAVVMILVAFLMFEDRDLA